MDAPFDVRLFKVLGDNPGKWIYELKVYEGEPLPFGALLYGIDAKYTLLPQGQWEEFPSSACNMAIYLGD